MLGPKMHFPFLQRCIRGFVFFRAGGGFLSWVYYLVVVISRVLGWVFLGFDFGFKCGYQCIISCVFKRHFALFLIYIHYLSKINLFLQIHHII